MKLHHLETLTALVDSGSLRGAARQLGLSQPAVTSRISEFESEIGALLVNRTVHGTTLTLAGRAMLRHARLIHGQVQRAQQEMAELSKGGIRSIAVGSSAIATAEVVAPAMAQLQLRDPQVQLGIKEGQFHQTSVRLREGELDMVITPIPGGKKFDKVFVIEELVAYPVLVVARPDHPQRHCTSLAELAAARWATGYATNNSTSALDELFQIHGLPKPPVAVTVDAFVPLHSCVAHSDVLGLLPQPLLEGVSGRLLALPIKDRIPPLRLGLITLAGVPLSPIAAEFAALIRQRAGQVAKAQAVRRRT